MGETNRNADWRMNMGTPKETAQPATAPIKAREKIFRGMGTAKPGYDPEKLIAECAEFIRKTGREPKSTGAERKMYDFLYNARRLYAQGYMSKERKRAFRKAGINLEYKTVRQKLNVLTAAVDSYGLIINGNEIIHPIDETVPKKIQKLFVGRVAEQDGKTHINVILYEEKIYDSARTLCEDYGLSFSLFCSRMNKNCAEDLERHIKEAIERGNGNRQCPSWDHEGNMFSSESRMCKYHGIGKKKFRDRILDGWSVKDALTFGISKRQIGNPDYHNLELLETPLIRKPYSEDDNGNYFRNKYAMIDFLNGYGKEVDRNPWEMPAKGVEFLSYFGNDPVTLFFRIKVGFSNSDAITRPITEPYETSQGIGMVHAKEKNKERREGMERIQNCGMKAKIFCYRLAQDIDVRFEDGTIVRNKAYSSFKAGSINNPNMKKSVGRQNCGNDLTIKGPDGRYYPSRKALADAYGVNYQTFCYRYHQGLPLRMCLAV